MGQAPIPIYLHKVDLVCIYSISDNCVRVDSLAQWLEHWSCTQHIVGPDLGPNCLQGYQQMTLVRKKLTRGLAEKKRKLFKLIQNLPG